MTERYNYQHFRAEYPDDGACLGRIMWLRYGGRPICQGCGKQTRYHRIGKRRAYACQFCGDHVYPCVGTIFEKSTTPLHKWFQAMYLFTTTRNGVAAKELERQLGVTYKCAWRMARQIRALMSDLAISGMSGDVEADETYIGGVKSGGARGRGTSKSLVIGVKQRAGRVKTKVVPHATRGKIEPFIRANVRKGSTVHTDEWWAYNNLHRHGYEHRTVNHGAKQWVDGSSHTNSIEGYWAQLKRSIHGTHIHVSHKYLPLYLGEFSFRHNLRQVPAQMFRLLVGMLRPGPVPDRKARPA